MLDTAPTALPNPVLAQQPVHILLAHFATALPWLSDAYGLVQTGTANDGKNRVPQLYRQDGTLHHIDVMPDQRMKALLFFERNGPSTIEWSDNLHLAGDWVHQYAAVAWLNMPLIDPLRTYDFSDELLQDFLNRGLLKSPLGSDLSYDEAEQRQERVFSRYTNWPSNQQLLMYPYGGFRVPFTVRQRYDACPPAFAPLAP